MFLFGFGTAYSQCEFNLATTKWGPKDFVYHGKQEKIVAAIKKVKEEVFLAAPRKKFFKAICAADDFTHTIESPKDISEWLYKANFNLKIRGYEGGADTLTLAYVNSEQYPNTVFINTSKLADENRRVSDVANTLIHEMIHMLDRKTEDAKFGHGDNSAEGKSKSAPYRIGRLAQKVIEREPLKFTEKDNLIAEDITIEEDFTIDESKVERWYR